MKKVVYFLVCFVLTSIVNADVILKGDIIIKESFSGVMYLGEVINESNTPVNYVKIVVTAKNSQGSVIDVTEGYVDGYNDPENGFSQTYIPIGEIAPFKLFGDAEADSIDSITYVINYETTDAVPEDPESVEVIGQINEVESWVGQKYYGEIINNSSKCVYYVQITFAFKDKNGKILDVDNTYINGEDYLSDGIFHTDTMISPGEIAPFSLLSSVTVDEVDSYYTIINYKIGEEETYYYEGSENVVLNGEINVIESYGNAKYLGEVRNDTNRDIYYVEITIISRNSEGMIIDISDGYVSGTPYKYDDFTTDTHIAPGETEPFEIYSSALIDSVATFDYRINYRYSETITNIQNESPLPFTVLKNYPNPFNPQTTIEFVLPDESQVELSVFNISGQKIDVLIDSFIEGGKHSVVWNASEMPSGVYFYRLKAYGISVTRKMLLLR